MNCYYGNFIFALYAFPFTHSEDDDECSNELITNSWIFNIFPLFVFLNSSSTSILFNNFASSSWLHSFFYASFSLVIHYSFSIALFGFILLWIPKLQKSTQLPAINTDYFQLFFFWSLNIWSIPFIFSFAYHLLINTWSLKLIWPITTSLCVPCITTWKH